ncbi:MAG: coproporphyrinogen III oxidase [Desulfobacteraceae bacterium 4572_123]|nr:MAG: coproporphyrinogen III oxidase [Desulfobacteraceae bacterium 4572_123]
MLMSGKNSKQEKYSGFEQGPIRPPSEAMSLLIRVTRNCPWNRCTFCPVYKDSRFSLRPAAHIKMDIDRVYGYVAALRQIGEQIQYPDRTMIDEIAAKVIPFDMQAMQAAVHWYYSGMESIFLQDANSLIIKPRDLVDVLKHLKTRFPWVKRITSYARSHTAARISDADLCAMSDAGLNRIHIGLESGSDEVLKMVAKGVTKAGQIKAGIKIKQAGMELSEYVMPGLGGRALSRIHALETADALNQINPDFIRLRTLAVPNHVPLFDEYAKGRFEKCTELMTVREILLFLEAFKGITSRVKSDHVLNLFQEIEGRLPDDRDRMVEVIQTFLSMPPEKQAVFQVGRRTGVFSTLADMQDKYLLARAEKTCKKFNVTPENVDEIVDEIMKRFI